MVYAKGSCLSYTFQQCLGKNIRIQEDTVHIPQEEIQKTLPNIFSLVNGGYLTLVQEIGYLCVCMEFPKHFTVI